MRKKWAISLALLAALALLSLPGRSQAGIFVGFGIPGPYYGPYHHHYSYGYYGPRIVVAAPPIYVGAAPAPVYVQQPPTVIYQQAPTLQTAPPTQYAPAPQTVAAHPPPVPVGPGN
jgi:hypothetical protein